MIDTISFLLNCVFIQIIIFIYNRDKNYKYFIKSLILELFLIGLLYIIYILNQQLNAIYRIIVENEKIMNSECIAYDLMPDEVFMY